MNLDEPKSSTLTGLLFRFQTGFGSGHFFRMREIQKKLGFPSVLLWENQSLSPLPQAEKISLQGLFDSINSLTSQEFKYIFLQKVKKKSHRSLVFDWRELLFMIEKNFAEPLFDLLLVDGRAHTQDDLNQMRSISRKIILLDDIGEARRDADLCIDSMPFAWQANIPLARQKKSGLKYLILNSRLQNQKPFFLKKKYSLFLSWGLQDPFQIETQAIQWLIQNDYLFRNLDLPIALFIQKENLVYFTETKRTHLGSNELRLYNYNDNYEQYIEILAQSRVVVGYFGLSLFEGWINQTLPVLFAPHIYHHELALTMQYDYADRGYDIMYPGVTWTDYGFIHWEKTMLWLLKNVDFSIAKKITVPEDLTGQGATAIAKEMAKILVE